MCRHGLTIEGSTQTKKPSESNRTPASPTYRHSLLKETVNNRKPMNRGISGAPYQTFPGHATESWIDRVARLEKLLTICPRDILTRCALASLLEELGQDEEALFNWKAVLSCDANNLEAREGMARCRLRIGRPLQSNI